MSHRITRTLVGATLVGAGAVAIALSGAPAASAAPASGPVYWESFGEFYFPGMKTCPETAAEYRARGDIILVNCGRGFAPGTYNLVGIRTGGS